MSFEKVERVLESHKNTFRQVQLQRLQSASCDLLETISGSSCTEEQKTSLLRGLIGMATQMIDQLEVG